MPSARLLGLILLALLGVGSAAAGPAAAAPPKQLRVGTLTLERCGDDTRWWCGELERPLDPAQPTGPKLGIAFRWLEASRGARGPALVAVEGGPGYPSSGSRVEFRTVFGPLLRTRDLLLVDNRGTGGSALIDCPRLQRYSGDTSAARFPRLVAACARRIERRQRLPRGSATRAAGLFSTAYAVRDLAAVMRALRLGRVDMFGDSYGTYFVQAFMARHPRLLHSVTLDSPYPVRQLDPWYASSGEVARAAMDAACARDAGCAAAGGSAYERLGELLTRLRERPIAGRTRDADGTAVRVRFGVRAVLDMVQDAASDPTLYRELDPAVRAALAGDDVPLVRLVAQSRSYLHSAGPADYFSNGLYWSVACQDYPQLFDMNTSPAERRAQLELRLPSAPAGAFAPFTVPEWLRMNNYSQPYTGCLDWPRPAGPEPAVPSEPRPLPASVPLLLVGGDLDSLTPISDARAFAPELAARQRVVTLANSTHVTSQGYTNLLVAASCAQRIIRGFIRAPRRLDELDARCARRIPQVHTAGAYPLRLAGATAAKLVAGRDPGLRARRAAVVAAGALADAPVRWFYSGAETGPGLRGGTFSVRGESPLLMRFDGIRFVEDATVDGRGSWRPEDGRIRGRLVVRAPGGPPVRVRLAWDQRSRYARARIGTARLRLPAP